MSQFTTDTELGLEMDDLLVGCNTTKLLPAGDYVAVLQETALSKNTKDPDAAPTSFTLTFELKVGPDRKPISRKFLSRIYFKNSKGELNQSGLTDLNLVLSAAVAYNISEEKTKEALAAKTNSLKEDMSSGKVKLSTAITNSKDAMLIIRIRLDAEQTVTLENGTSQTYDSKNSLNAGFVKALPADVAEALLSIE